MSIAANVFVGLVALAHLYFMVLEMFLWTTPYGRKVFGRTEAQALETASLAKNQGLYNGFLSAGLVWGLVSTGIEAFHLKLFFLACVIVAGLYGSVTASKKILFVQALPAAIALALVFVAR